ncbi:MAG: DNA polymerase IV [Galbitalea sp.]
MDEAFLDVAGARRLLGSPWQIATGLRARVRAETGLTCSIGIATTKFVAKLASGWPNPTGCSSFRGRRTLDFLHPLPIAALWGVGAKTAEQLERLGLRTVGDVAQVPLASLTRALGSAAGEKLHALAWARDPRAVTTVREEKSVGHEVTFEYDVTDPARIRRELLRMSDQVAVRLRGAGLVGRTVVLKLRYGDFTTITRSRKLQEHTDLGRRIYDEVIDVYRGVERPRRAHPARRCADGATRPRGRRGSRTVGHRRRLARRRAGRGRRLRAVRRGLVQPAALLKPPRNPD